MIIGSFGIDNESEADDFLSSLLAEPQYRSMGEVNRRSHKLIKNDHLKDYFVEKAKEILETYGHKIA